MKSPIIRTIVCVILLLAIPVIYLLGKNSTSSGSEFFDYQISAQGPITYDNSGPQSLNLEGVLYLNTSQQYCKEMQAEYGMESYGTIHTKETSKKKGKNSGEKTETYYITSVTQFEEEDGPCFNMTLYLSEINERIEGVLLNFNRSENIVYLRIPANGDNYATLMMPLTGCDTTPVKVAGHSIFSPSPYIVLPLSGGKELPNYVAKFYGDSSSIWIPLGLCVCFVTAIYMLLCGRITASLVLLAGIAICAVTTFMSWTVAVPFIAPFIIFCIMLPFRVLRRYLLYVSAGAFVLNCLLCIVLFWNEYSFFTFIWKCAYIGIISMMSAMFVGVTLSNMICFTCGRFIGSKTYRTNWVFDNARQVLNLDYSRNGSRMGQFSASNENGKNVCYWCYSPKEF